MHGLLGWAARVERDTRPHTHSKIDPIFVAHGDGAPIPMFLRVWSYPWGIIRLYSDPRTRNPGTPIRAGPGATSGTHSDLFPNPETHSGSHTVLPILHLEISIKEPSRKNFRNRNPSTRAGPLNQLHIPTF